MAFWNKDQKDTAKPAHADLGRNDPCHCGSGKKYKKCCSDKDQTAEHKVIEENWNKSAAEAKAEAEKEAKAAKDNPAAPQKHAPGHQQPAQPKHQKFVASQTSLPRKSGGG